MADVWGTQWEIEITNNGLLVLFDNQMHVHFVVCVMYCKIPCWQS